MLKGQGGDQPEPEYEALASDTYICGAGHVTEAFRDEASADRLAGFHERCRRIVDTSRVPPPEWEFALGPFKGRCRQPVIRASLLPEVYSAFRLGGEPAVQQMIGAIGWESIAATKE